MELRLTREFEIASFWSTALYRSIDSIHPRITKTYQDLCAQPRRQLSIFRLLERHLFSLAGR